MINKNKTLTVGHLLQMLADGRITVDTPVAFLTHSNTHSDIRGIVATELMFFKNGEKAVVFSSGDCCASTDEIVSTSEVF